MPKLTPAHLKINEYIAQHKLIPVDQFMQIATQHYYAHHEPFGEEGDFITAPEASQMFGEIIGVWCTNVWSKLKLGKFSLVEIGGGRGLLMKDLLRATKHIAEFNDALEHIYLVENSDRLVRIQQAEIKDDRAKWVSHIDLVPQGNLLVIANEFFDALPIKQYKNTKGGWKERIITNTAKKLEFSLAKNPTAIAYSAPEGSILETSEVRLEYARHMAEKVAQGALLIIDYGYIEKTFCSTLQAVKGHKYHEVLKDIGNADLTTHVDFSALIQLFNSLGFASHIVTQGDFLLDYGIGLRAKKLIENGAKEGVIMNQLNRLVHPEQMGELFKVLQVVLVGIAK